MDILTKNKWLPNAIGNHLKMQYKFGDNTEFFYLCYVRDRDLKTMFLTNRFY